MKTHLLGTLPIIATLPSLSAFTYSEDVSGDLADSASTPTLFVLDSGRNTISANVLDRDDDFFTLRVLAGSAITSITLLSYNHPLIGNDSFLGYQSGLMLDQAPSDLTRGEISFVLIGADQRGLVLNNLFAANPSSASARFPLPAGDYAFWLNETDDLPASVSLDFQVDPVPEPHTVFFSLLSPLLLMRRKRLHSNQLQS